MYTNTQVAAIFSTTRETLRRWAIEFADHLSVTANPVDNSAIRQFTNEDLRVLALVWEYKAERKRFADIHVALLNGERGEPPDDVTALALVGKPHSIAIHERVVALEQLLAQKEAELLEARGNLTEARRQAEELQKQLFEAYKVIGRLQP